LTFGPNSGINMYGNSLVSAPWIGSIRTA
jgi:hypothetical protein